MIDFGWLSFLAQPWFVIPWYVIGVFGAIVEPPWWPDGGGDPRGGPAFEERPGR